MNRKRLIYHKENIEEAGKMVEEFVAHKNADRNFLRVYGIMKACVLAIGFILDEMEREDRNGKR